MDQNCIKEVMNINGMICVSCESLIEENLRKTDGLISVKASFKLGIVEVEFDSLKVSSRHIKNIIQNLNYEVIETTEKSSDDRSFSTKYLIVIGIVILALYLIIKNTIGFNFIPEITSDMGYGILFIVGLLTSLHCIAMCMGINLSQCVSYKDNSSSKTSKITPSLLYNLGRIISYTAIGGFAGYLGSAVSFSGRARGFVAIVAGIFMIIMALNMLNIIPWLRKINPRIPRIFRKKITHKTLRRPLIVGLLNGFMPCGPLQSMQLYALGTGSFLAGAASMFMFSLGTVPLMFGLGAVSTMLSSKFTKNIMKIGALLVMVLGIIMFNRGLNLSGINFSLLDGGINTNNSNIATIHENVQYVVTSLDEGNYSPIIVENGIPVKWNIIVKEENLNGCNNPITIPKYNKQVTLVPGDNLIEFTPEEEGEITYTCWMGMISSTINIVSDIDNVFEDDILKMD